MCGVGLEEDEEDVEPDQKLNLMMKMKMHVFPVCSQSALLYWTYRGLRRV